MARWCSRSGGSPSPWDGRAPRPARLPGSCSVLLLPVAAAASGCDSSLMQGADLPGVLLAAVGARPPAHRDSAGAQRLHDPPDRRADRRPGRRPAGAQARVSLNLVPEHLCGRTGQRCGGRDHRGGTIFAAGSSPGRFTTAFLIATIPAVLSFGLGPCAGRISGSLIASARSGRGHEG